MTSKQIIASARNSQVWGFFVSVVIMAAISLAFFYPGNFDGGVLRQADMQQGMANGHEAQQYYEATGEKALWTNSLFSGMPTFQISPQYPSNALFDWLNAVYGLGLPSPSNLLFMMMLGMLILLYVMRMRWYVALLGAIAWGFSSYYIIIIGAGHIWKFLALSYVPPTIGGMLLCYRGRYLGGAAMLSLFAMLQLEANHPQMSYYFAFVMAALAAAALYSAWREGKMRRWCTATCVVVASGLLALGANAPSIYNTYEYAKETKRAQSELTQQPAAAGGEDEARPTGGMPYEQIVGWSYGPSETFSLLVPNIKGGASARPEGGAMVHMGLDRLDAAAAYSGQPMGQMLPYLPQYFNDSEGTNGPVYVGAIVCALFLLGCLIVRGAAKWALLGVTLFAALLALGRNFTLLTDFMIYHFPMYNKFRAVESILVIVEFTMPLLAVMALCRMLSMPAAERGALMRPLLVAFGIPAAICLCAALAPSLFGKAITMQDQATAQALQQQIVEMGRQYGASEAEIQSAVYNYSLSNPANVEVIEQLRYGLVRADAWRSLLFLAVGFCLMALLVRGRLRDGLAVGLLAGAVLVDLYGVDKRYLSADSFCAPEVAAADPFAPDAVDRLILADTTAAYRVMDIPGFNSPQRSYHHRMLGGYHAAKLRRYEDLIQRRLNYVLHYGYDPSLRDDSVRALYDGTERQIADELAASYRTLDMLNARYVITGDPQAPVVVNTSAQGPGWLVDSLAYVDGADAEMQALRTLDVRHAAVADRSMAEALGEGVPSLAPGDTVVLTDYTPNRTAYRVSSEGGGVAVFSEVYFPWGWKATIDGAPAKVGRVNYILRAVRVPAGTHEVVLTFSPDSIRTSGIVAYACVSLIYLFVLGGIFVSVVRKEDGK